MSFFCRSIAGSLTFQRSYSNVSKPLDVLFFGSDHFSVHSLNALYNLKKEAPKLIGDIQVVTRSTKKCGRNLSVTKSVPIARLSYSLGLPRVIECDSKEDMLGPLANAMQTASYDMIIAVSFGKLIPKQLLSKVSYTLNVHPSLLPRYKGSSPIQYTLLNGDETTGVSIQTLHPEKFDCGQVVAQTEPESVQQLLQEGDSTNVDAGLYSDPSTPPKVSKLMDALGDRGAKLLTHVIEEGLYGTHRAVQTPYAESFAPKTTTKMRQIQWDSDTAQTAIRKMDALGSVYAFKKICKKNGDPTQLKRVIFHNLSAYDDAEKVPAILGLQPGSFEYDETHRCVAIRVDRKHVLQCSTIQFEGFKIETPEQFFKSLRKRCGTLSTEKTFA
ncbi:LAME_0F01178g1_1 [Lachancea meyersii CBS 8951]|uniref:Methionyl-tRNA formyltransferase, mitochondrial n=1 Tax=Lachancea meyersii CBS 8951 TaxID=1266667 RepID=A0A1G4JPQ8_9SACH|nr:LAME_0F01178g1_1 [Lachancea meyersii CBS 8951]